MPDNNPNRMHGTLHQIILNYFCGAQAPIKRAAVPAGHGGRPVLVPVGYVGYLNTQMRRKDQTGFMSRISWLYGRSHPQDRTCPISRGH